MDDAKKGNVSKPPDNHEIAQQKEELSSDEKATESLSFEKAVHGPDETGEVDGDGDGGLLRADAVKLSLEEEESQLPKEVTSVGR